jgi:hypothetical protein
MPGIILRRLAFLILSLSVAGCDSSDNPTDNPSDPLVYTHPLAEGTVICGRPDFNEMFPYSIRSRTHPVLVHYYNDIERDTALQVLAFVEKGWDYHVNNIGMRQPLTDNGECGPDDAFDVFVWKGHRSCLVDALSGDSSTPWEDRRCFMIIDPWGPYGGPALEETVVHEMAHAAQAADDWYETPIVFEMSAVFTDQLYADCYIETYFNDFQSHPDWALDRDDQYGTWYMYGASMYLLYLKDRFFENDAQFLSRLWFDSRSPSGAESDQTLNDPDFFDALDAMLKKKGSSYLETVPEFSRWRWYTGDNIDDRHFRHFRNGLDNLKDARLALAARAEARPGRVRISEEAPMMLGTSYIALSADADTPQALYVSLDAPPDASRYFVVQAVPGLTPDSDGEILDLSSGPQELRFAADQNRTLIITVLPTMPYDPDTRTDERYPFSIVLSDNPEGDFYALWRAGTWNGRHDF